MSLSVNDPASQKFYLKVQELTPSENGAQTIGQEMLAIPVYSYTTLIIMAAILAAGLGGFMYGRINEIKRLMAVLVILWIMATIPVALGLVTQPTQITSKAVNNPTPTNVTIQNVTSNILQISWETPIPSVGSISYQLLGDPDDVQVVSNPDMTNWHSFNITHLKSNSTYLIHISSNGIWYDHSSQPLIVNTAAR